MGRIFCKTLVDYVDNQERVNRVFTELKNRFPQGGGCVRGSNQYNNKTDEEKDFWNANKFQQQFTLELNSHLYCKYFELITIDVLGWEER